MARYWAINQRTGHLLAYDPKVEVARGDMSGGPPSGYTPLDEFPPDALVTFLPAVIEQLLDRG